MKVVLGYCSRTSRRHDQLTGTARYVGIAFTGIGLINAMTTFAR